MKSFIELYKITIEALCNTSLAGKLAVVFLFIGYMIPLIVDLEKIPVFKDYIQTSEILFQVLGLAFAFVWILLVLLDASRAWRNRRNRRLNEAEQKEELKTIIDQLKPDSLYVLREFVTQDMDCICLPQTNQSVGYLFKHDIIEEVGLASTGHITLTRTYELTPMAREIMKELKPYIVHLMELQDIEYESPRPENLEKFYNNKQGFGYLFGSEN